MLPRVPPDRRTGSGPGCTPGRDRLGSGCPSGGSGLGAGAASQPSVSVQARSSLATVAPLSHWRSRVRRPPLGGQQPPQLGGIAAAGSGDTPARSSCPGLGRSRANQPSELVLSVASASAANPGQASSSSGCPPIRSSARRRAATPASSFLAAWNTTTLVVVAPVCAEPAPGATSPLNPNSPCHGPGQAGVSSSTVAWPAGRSSPSQQGAFPGLAGRGAPRGCRVAASNRPWSSEPCR